MVRTVAVFAILPCLLYLARKVYVSYGETQEVAVFKAHVFAVRCGAFMATAFMASFGAATSSLQLFALASAGGMDALWDVACRVQKSYMYPTGIFNKLAKLNSTGGVPRATPVTGARETTINVSSRR